MIRNTKEFVYQLARAHVELRTVPLGSPEYKAVTACAVDLVALLDRSRLIASTPTPSNLPNLDTTDGIDRAIERVTRALQSLTLLRRARADDNDAGFPVAAAERAAEANAPAPYHRRWAAS